MGWKSQSVSNQGGRLGGKAAVGLKADGASFEGRKHQVCSVRCLGDTGQCQDPMCAAWVTLGSARTTCHGPGPGWLRRDGCSVLARSSRLASALPLCWLYPKKWGTDPLAASPAGWWPGCLHTCASVAPRNHRTQVSAPELITWVFAYRFFPCTMEKNGVQGGRVCLVGLSSLFFEWKDAAVVCAVPTSPDPNLSLSLTWLEVVWSSLTFSGSPSPGAHLFCRNKSIS